MDADVVVVGAGPSGLMVGAELALAGVKVVILEKRGEPAMPRAGVLHPRVLEIFESRGIADRFLSRARELHAHPEASEVIWAGLPGVRYDRLDSSFPFMLLLAQVETEQILFNRVLELGGVVRRHSEVMAMRQDADGVDVDVSDGGGATRTLRCKYLVGADGSRSTVRQALGIQFLGEEATRTAINVDVRLENPWSAPVTVTNNIHGWGLSYPLKDGITRFGLIDAIASKESRDEPVTLDAAKAMLQRIFGTDFGITEVVWLTRFHNALFLADRFRVGRVFIVGEAVRVHYPASGVGMNFCLMDAFNLGWKIAAAVKGWAPDWLLDSYESERRPTIEALLDDVRRQCAIQFNYSQDMVALKRLFEHELIPLDSVNEVLRNSISGIGAQYRTPDGSHRLAGRRVRDAGLVEGGTSRRTSIYELLHGQKFALVDFDGNAQPLPSVIADRVNVFSAEPAVTAELEGISSLLLRPDGHIAWASETPGDKTFNAELRRWINIDAASAQFATH
ncbi:FAD-dependent monooxygenase [Roseiarcaceae bacterium H3SJ34-1]|uniref:FAD-dependent monooxygenase n=1 Tax=Terripilifer ovatus TaxID=3032367 RepID=UPI003AB931B8|nr:FAD-dependent monooxygenase [Roseiarcaceae bacterium H3SJ34-1]